MCEASSERSPGDTHAAAPARGRFPALVAPALRERPVRVGVTVMACAQLLGGALGVAPWRCPILTTLHVPCPGCGLTTALVGFMNGRWLEALRAHAFAPVAASGVVLAAISVVLRASARQRLLDIVETAERRTGVTAAVAVTFVAYYLIRLAWFRSEVIAAIENGV